MANRAYKFQEYINSEQKILFAKTFGCVRMVYNHWLDRKIRQYRGEQDKRNIYPFITKEKKGCNEENRRIRIFKEVGVASHYNNHSQAS